MSSFFLFLLILFFIIIGLIAIDIIFGTDILETLLTALFFGWLEELDEND